MGIWEMLFPTSELNREDNTHKTVKRELIQGKTGNDKLNSGSYSKKYVGRIFGNLRVSFKN